MKHQSDTSLRIRLSAMAILALFIALATAAYYSGRQVQRSSELFATDAVPGTINAHYMRLTMTRGIGWVLVAASAQTPEFRDASLKIVHDADAAFTNYVKEYEKTIVINPEKDRALVGRLTSAFAEFHRQRLAYEALILAGNRAGSAAYLETNLVSAYVAALKPAEELVSFNHANSLAYADSIRKSIRRLYWTVAVVTVLALISAVVLVVNIAMRRREIMRLRESEELFRTSFESATVGVCLVGTDGTFLNVNRTLCDLLGYSKDELLQLTFSDVTHDEDKNIGRSFLASALAGGPKGIQLEKRYVRKDGRVVWAYVSSALIEGTGERDGYLITYVQDTTERKRAQMALHASEQRLRESESKFRRILETVSLVGVILDQDSRITLCNDYLLAATGWKREEVLNQNWFDLFTPSDVREAMRQEVSARVVATGTLPAHFENEIITKQGERRLIAWNNIVIRNEDGSVNGVGAIGEDITERKRAEQAVKASEAALKEAQRLAHIGSSMWDARTDKTSWSDELYRIVGWDPTVPPPTHQERKNLYTPASFSILDRAVQRALATGEPYDLQLEIVRPDGERRQVHARGTCMRDASGAIIGLRGTLQDITERRRLEEKQVELAAIVASSDDAIIGKSLTGIITSWNRGAEKIFGYSAAEAIGQPLLMLIPADRQHEEADILEKIGRGEAVEHYETVRTRRDGRQIFISATISPLLDGGGKVVGASKIARDITKNKQAERELMWKTAFLEAQVDSALDGILVVDDRAKRTLQNERLFQLFKVPEAIAHDDDDTKLLGYVLDRVKAPDKFSERVAYLYAHPNEIGRDEIELLDGTILDRYSSPVRDKTGRYYGRIWTFRDITEQRQLELQFRQSQKMEAFGQLAGGVAHDFNNILMVISLHAAMLGEGGNLSPEQKVSAEEIGKAAMRAANLTRQLLLFSRKHTMQAHDIDLEEVVGNLTKMLQRTLGAQIKLQFRTPEQALFVHADAGMIDQILLNLTVNARDAMPRGGQINIETTAAEFDEVLATQRPRSRPGSFVCLSVSDTGTGIPPEVLPRIFEPFFTTKEAGKGTGLGLATVFGIVQQHNGWIEVDTEVGRGTTFKVFLPRLCWTPEKESAEAALEFSLQGNETLLLVEDETALRTAVRNVLTRLGYRVLEAATGDEALKIWKTHGDQISLLVTDLVMPGGMTGKELADGLLQASPRLKVIFVSGYSAEAMNKGFVFEDGVNFLHKPFSGPTLAKAIRENLKKTSST